MPLCLYVRPMVNVYTFPVVNVTLRKSYKIGNKYSRHLNSIGTRPYNDLSIRHG